MLKLYPHVMVSDSKHCKSFIINLFLVFG